MEYLKLKYDDKMQLEKVSDSELKAEMKKRNLSTPHRLVIKFDPDDFLYCDKCGAPVDKKGNYRPD